jgi:hypothetical protein
MWIEVAVPSNFSTKDRGDLLEKLSKEFLESQNFDVTDQLRVTATEIDLLCKHKVNKKTIYVECKAYRDNLSSNFLVNLLGNLTFHNYQEAWLISTGPLGKDAKGFQHEWELKPPTEAQKLSIYTPEKVVQALINTKVIVNIPKETALNVIIDKDKLGEWILLITPYGNYWAITCLVGGMPKGVIIFSAKTGELVREINLLKNISKTDTTLNKLDFEYIKNFKPGKNTEAETFPNYQQVVEVQYGESWADYRPARPEHFVGREEMQTKLIHFLENVRTRETTTRVFAITGDSGMGKSSLITKLRSRTKNVRYRKKFFIYAVDVRAAMDENYLLWALFAGLKNAAKQGFGSGISNKIQITNFTDPLSSPSIIQFLNVLEEKNEVICLIFDQFEELYSKNELFPIFDATKKLLVSCTALKSNLVLGFAWKSDTTVHQDHPAYFMWHRLADHRLEVNLAPFNPSETSKAITLFEKEIDEKLRPELRRQLQENSRGYPWLLKKFCIHIFEQLSAKVSQTELVNKGLDIRLLFDKELQNLSSPENTCLKMIAQSAPADWYEILEASDQTTLRSLLDKRLVIRSGNKLNLYWDIFKEYVLTEKVPAIPLSYLPSSPSIQSLIKVTQILEKDVEHSTNELSDISGLVDKTVGNVIRDLIMFGVAIGTPSRVKLDPSGEGSDPMQVLRQFRKVLKRHALTLIISKLNEGSLITRQDIVKYLKKINPTAQHRERTWQIYADRMAAWLTVTGFLEPKTNGWIYNDQGKINLQVARRIKRQGRPHSIFIGDSPPHMALKALEWLKINEPITKDEILKKGFRNAFAVLGQLGMLRQEGGKFYRGNFVKESINKLHVLLWEAAKSDPTLQKVVEYIKKYPISKGIEIGKYINEEYQREWATGSIIRTGGSLRRWGIWILSGIDSKDIPIPIARRNYKRTEKSKQISMF